MMSPIPAAGQGPARSLRPGQALCLPFLAGDAVDIHALGAGEGLRLSFEAVGGRTAERAHPFAALAAVGDACRERERRRFTFFRLLPVLIPLSDTCAKPQRERDLQQNVAARFPSSNRSDSLRSNQAENAPPASHRSSKALGTARTGHRRKLSSGNSAFPPPGPLLSLLLFLFFFLFVSRLFSPPRAALFPGPRGWRAQGRYTKQSSVQTALPRAPEIIPRVPKPLLPEGGCKLSLPPEGSPLFG